MVRNKYDMTFFDFHVDDMPTDDTVINVAAPAAASTNGVGNDGAGAGLLPTPSAVRFICIHMFKL